MSQERPTRVDAATAGMSLVGAMLGCGAIGYVLGSLVGAEVLLGLVGLFVGIVGGMVLVHARFRRI
ncbi:MAG TPA: AtpZ/AtpI family protein [Solirubrobacterales bacterium]|nr:AtpZ/AtpI family protein [Solirubrobacterales bacterium]